MEIILYILTGLILVFIILIFLPVSITINNKEHIYEICLFNILRINPVYDNDFDNYIYLNLKFLSFNYKYDFISKISISGKAKKEKKISEEKKKVIKKKRKKRVDYRKVFRLVSDLMKSFKIHHFSLNIDTSNYILNGMLIPVFSGLQNKKTKLNINFNEYYEIDFKISNRLSNVIFPILKYLIIKGDMK